MRVKTTFILANLGVSLVVLLLPPSGIGESKTDKTIHSTHFIINYYKDIDEAYVAKVKDLCEEFYRQITQEFYLVRDKPWLWKNRAQVYIAKDKDDYLDKSNFSSWSGACVDYDKKIIYTYPQQEGLTSIFAHELTHIIFREYVGKTELPLWLNEGISVYVENKFGNAHPQYQLSSLQKLISSNEYTPLAKLNKITIDLLNKQSEEYVKNFYVQSFSLVHFLIEQYGRFHFSKLLSSLKSGYPIEEALAKSYHSLPSFERLEKQWMRFYQK